MNLLKAYINNFRSIKYVELNFSIPFQIFVGKNESGKSNILKALSHLDPKNLPTKDDIREGVNNLDKNNIAQIIFEFQLDEEELNQVYQKLKTVFDIDDDRFDSLIVTTINDKKYTLNKLCHKYNKALFVVNLNTLTNYYSYWSQKEKWKINNTLKWNDGIIDQNNGTIKAKFKKYQIVDISLLTDEEKISFTDITGEMFHKLISEHIYTFLKNNHPKVINWKYDENNLLPEAINIESFINDPNSCLPLKTMFELAEIKNVKEAISSYRSTNSYHKLNNFFEKIAEGTTKHFREVWKEYKNIEFKLNLNGATIVTGIKETNTYSFNQRSDGFKRFVTFLLMISATYKTEKLKNAILLIDEPDISLHPSGIRYLRDELTKISKHNIVCASTHSIFLIDNNNINRHFIVKKENEITNIEEVNENNIVNEEIIYNALGFSFYETLKLNNLVFEGWRDKELFKKSLEKSGAETKILREYFKNFGICHINGVKEAKGIAPILELAGREFIIISDNDEVAIGRKKEFVKDKTSGVWLTYKDCYESCPAITGEDFLKKEYIIQAISTIKLKVQDLIGNPDFEKSNLGVISELNRWLEKECNISDSQKRKELINQIKEELFTSLKHNNIESLYYDFLHELKRKIESKS